MNTRSIWYNLSYTKMLPMLRAFTALPLRCQQKELLQSRWSWPWRRSWRGSSVCPLTVTTHLLIITRRRRPAVAVLSWCFSIRSNKHFCWVASTVIFYLWKHCADVIEDWLVQHCWIQGMLLGGSCTIQRMILPSLQWLALMLIPFISSWPSLHLSLNDTLHGPVPDIALVAVAATSTVIAVACFHSINAVFGDRSSHNFI